MDHGVLPPGREPARQAGRQRPVHRTMNPLPPVDLTVLQAQVELARGELGLGDHAAASRTLQSVLREAERLRAAPAFSYLHNEVQQVQVSAASLLGQALLAHGRTADALPWLRQAVACFGSLTDESRARTSHEWADYGVALDLLDQHALAMAALEQAIALGDASLETHRRLGSMLLQAGRLSEAESFFSIALKLSWIDPVIRRLLGDVHRVRGRPADAAEAYRHAAFLAMEAGQHEEALQVLYAAVELVPDDPRLHIAIGDILLTLRRQDEGLEVLDRALTLDPESAVPLASKGEALRLMGRHHEAIEVLDRALAIEPDFAFALANKGDALRALGWYAEALQALDRALALNPDDTWTLGIRGQTLRATGRLEEARSTIQRAVEADPELGWAWAELAAIEQMLGAHDAAVKAADRALVQEPDSELALAAKGLALREFGLDQESTSAFEALVRINPRNVWARVELARAWFAAGRLDEALAELAQTLDADPDDQGAMMLRIDILESAGRIEEAVQEYEQVVLLWPNDSRAWVRLGKAHQQLGHLEAAYSALGRALVLDPDNAWALAMRGHVLRALGRSHKAVEVLQHAHSLNPSMDSATIDLVELLRELGRSEEAHRLTEQVLESDPDNEYARTTKADLELGLGRYDHMLRTLEPLGSDTRSDRVWWLRGEALRLLGNSEEARRALKRALEEHPENVTVLSSLGQVMLAERRLDRARGYFEQAIRIQPEDPRLLTDLALVQHTGGEHLRALDLVNQVLAVDPENPWALRAQARIFSDIGAFAKAVQVLERILTVAPPTASVFQALGWALANTDPARISDAHDAYIEAVKLDGHDLWIRRGLADTIAVLRGSAVADNEYRRIIHAIECQDNLGIDTVGLLGWCHYSLGQYRRAVRVYASALSSTSISIENAYLYFDFALALLARGQVRVSLRRYRGAVVQVASGVPLRRQGFLLTSSNDMASCTPLRLRGLLLVARNNLHRLELRRIMPDAAKAARRVLDEALMEMENTLSEPMLRVTH